MNAGGGYGAYTKPANASASLVTPCNITVNSSGGDEARPKNVALMYIISADGTALPASGSGGGGGGNSTSLDEVSVMSILLALAISLQTDKLWSGIKLWATGCPAPSLAVVAVVVM